MQTSSAEPTHFQFATQQRTRRSGERSNTVQLIHRNGGVGPTTTLMCQCPRSDHSLAHHVRTFAWHPIDEIIHLRQTNTHS